MWILFCAKEKKGGQNKKDEEKAVQLLHFPTLQFRLIDAFRGLTGIHKILAHTHTHCHATWFGEMSEKLEEKGASKVEGIWGKERKAG